MEMFVKGARVRLRAILPEPDPRSWVAYTVLVVLAFGAYVGLAATGLQFSVAWAWPFSKISIVIIFVAWMLRRAGHSSISTGLETISFSHLLATAGVIIQYPLMALPLPFTDAMLSRADHALGLDWRSLAQLLSEPWVRYAILKAYGSVIPQTLILLVLLSWSRRHERAWQFLTASSLAMLTTMVILPFFPADGSLALCDLRSDNPWITENFCSYGPIIHQLKEGQLKILGDSALVGLASFPSFHTSIGLLFVWGFWPFRWLRWPLTVFNLMLVCGTIVFASHYFIDIIGGAIIGLLAIPAARVLIGLTVPASTPKQLS